jgi:hypothetical protein
LPAAASTDRSFSARSTRDRGDARVRELQRDVRAILCRVCNESDGAGALVSTKRVAN